MCLRFRFAYITMAAYIAKAAYSDAWPRAALRTAGGVPGAASYAPSTCWWYGFATMMVSCVAWFRNNALV